jgi:hypothetical protein
MIQSNVALAVHFLRMLCAPAAFRRAYLQAASDRSYAAELSAGYVKGRAGIRLLFILGHDALVSSETLARVPRDAMEFVNDLSVILSLLIEGEDAQLLSLAYNIHDHGGGLAANAWAQVGALEAGRSYRLKMPASLGGDYEDSNLAALTTIELVGVTGDIALQIRDLPEGTPVEIKIVD